MINGIQFIDFNQRILKVYIKNKIRFEIIII